MTVAELAERVAALERALNQVRRRLGDRNGPSTRWWIDRAGRFAHDPVFDEIVRLGAEYRMTTG